MRKSCLKKIYLFQYWKQNESAVCTRIKISSYNIENHRLEPPKKDRESNIIHVGRKPNPKVCTPSIYISRKRCNPISHTEENRRWTNSSTIFSKKFFLFIQSTSYERVMSLRDYRFLRRAFWNTARYFSFSFWAKEKWFFFNQNERRALSHGLQGNWN